METLLERIPKKLFIITCLLAFLFSIGDTGFTTIVAKAVTADLELIPAFIICISLLIVAWTLNEFILNLLLGRLCETTSNNLYRAYFQRIYRIKPEILRDTSTGYISSILQRLVSDTEVLLEQATSTGIDLVYIVSVTIVLGYRHTSIIPIVLLSGFGGAIIRVAAGKYLIHDAAIEHAKAVGERNRVFQDSISNINTIQKLRAIDFFTERLDDVMQSSAKARRYWSERNETAFAISKLVSYFIAPSGLSVMYFIDRDIFSDVTYLALFSSVCTQLPHSNRALARLVRAYDKFIASYKAMDTITSIDNKRCHIVDVDFKKIELINVEYSYKDESSVQQAVIRIPSFVVEKGDIVCITGESGQGKTTLLNILSGEIETSNVLVNDTLTSHRLDCVYIGQDTEMFDMSLRDNLTLGKDVNPYTIFDYIESVGLSKWFDSLEDELDTILGERGVFVSTGQRQRINLIRGLLYTDKEIYILDEPTSNVDEITEERIIHLIKKVLKDKTLIIVTHRDKLLELGNKFYEFKDGVLYRR